MTSRYNIYFNGRESFKKGVERVEAGHMDDYSNLLEIFEYSDPSTQSLCAGDMERAIQKASKVISLKSITVKPDTKDNSLPSDREEEFMNRKEYNEWVDDAYLLMGKARLYKRDYELAKSTLSYNISSSVDEEIKKESTIWLSRIYNETGNYNESFRILNEMNPSENFSDYMKGLYYTTLADLYMKQKRYPDAIDPLGKSLEYISGKRNNYRLTYLLAQLYEKNGDAAMATTLYRKVVKMNPPYEVEFNARINIAGVFDLNSGSPESIKKELKKMLRDSKNKDFLDQIYFALGKLYEKEGNYEEAVTNYKNSAASSTINRNQLAKSFLSLADYYFSLPDYVNAGKYYDSTLLVIDQKYPDYQFIRSVSLSLNELVTQLSVIQREDSLQRVAKMNPDQRNSLIALIIQDITQNEANKANTSQYADQYNLGQYYENERRFQNNIQAEGKWYFYNQTALAFGRTEFKRRWGDRRLEDNWRRMNKARISQGQTSTGQEEKEQVKMDTLAPEMNNKSPEFYMRDLPMNDSLLALSDEKIAGAFLEAGKIYKDNFRDNAKALESFETFLRRFPGNSLEPEALYNIYTLFKEENDPRAEIYRQRLVEKYPESEFSKIITDPDYYNKKLEQLRQAEMLYQNAYEAYLNENFSGALSICDSSLTLFSKHELAPKFMLLRSFCIARTSDERAFKEELGKLVKRWPETPESQRASEIIAYLNKEIPQLQIEEDTRIAQEIYFDEKDSPHTFVLIILNPKFNFNQASFDVISYNIDNYTNNNYRTQGSLVDDKYIMLTVSGFVRMEEAMDYYNSFRKELIVRNPSSSPMMTFIIGRQNLEAFVKDKNPDRYMIFFREKYLNEIKR